MHAQMRRTFVQHANSEDSSNEEEEAEHEELAESLKG